jgi:hypothetical protein
MDAFAMPALFALGGVFVVSFGTLLVYLEGLIGREA